MLTVSTYTKGYRVAGLLAAIDSSGPGVVKLYDGSAPSNCGSLTTQILYASIPLKTPSGYVAGTTLSLAAARLRYAGN